MMKSECNTFVFIHHLLSFRLQEFFIYKIESVHLEYAKKLGLLLTATTHLFSSKQILPIKLKLLQKQNVTIILFFLATRSYFLASKVFLSRKEDYLHRLYFKCVGEYHSIILMLGKLFPSQSGVIIF